MRGPADFELDWTLGFLATRAAPSLERVGANRLSRGIAPGRRGSVTLECSRDRRGVRFRVSPAQREPVVRRLLDLDRDLGPFRTMARADRILAPLVAARPGLRVPQTIDPFEALVRAVLGQVVSVRAATTLLDRLVAAFGPESGQGLRAFPAAVDLAPVRPTHLTRLGISRPKTTAILAAARAIATGALDWTLLASQPGAEVDRRLTAVPGIGPWTAGYVRLRGLADPDAFLASDHGVIQALAKRGLTGRAVRRVSDRWRPWRSLAVIHLWAAG